MSLLNLKMARGVLGWYILALVGCATSTVAFSSVPILPSANLPPCRKVSWGKSLTPLRPSTSLNSAILGAVDTFYKTMPLASAFVTCGIKASLADLVAQKRSAQQAIEANREDYLENDAIILGDIEETSFEKRRNFAFLLYGGLYQGEFDSR